MIISNLVNVLTIFSIHFATHLINKSVSFHGKHKILWVIPNFWTVVYIYIYATELWLSEKWLDVYLDLFETFLNAVSIYYSKDESHWWYFLAPI